MIGEPWNPLQHDVSKATDSLFEREDLFKMNQRLLELDDRNSYHVTRNDF